MRAFGWTVLALVFLDELLTVAALAVVGWAAAPAWLLVWSLPALGVAAWAAFASPRAPYGGPVLRPVVKALVFGAASLGLVAAGHPGWGVALLVFSVVVNGLALLPDVQRLTTEAGR
ncbi:YrdB family protein [Nocardioides anomalus]|uniref:YrdB family protein n=1 Tax=Nocardioides anomalus TaxID=2712223 RepID=A0A6G6WAA4_9ACTN|nr:DUF2568 domain-containing protein [Nocardioides anomalus]QIG42162.1 YrdB family protein [Nocardioides anomalus]